MSETLPVTRIALIVIAISMLNKDNPSHFLADGTTPQIGVLEELSKLEDITAAERDEALNQVNVTPPSTGDRDVSILGEVAGKLKDPVAIIAKTMVRVKEGEEQKAWGSSFIATKVRMEDPDTDEVVEHLVLLGAFEKDGYEHVSFMSARPRRGMIFKGEII